MPGEFNMVIVKFYDNFRFEEGANVGLKVGPLQAEEVGEDVFFYRLLTFRVQGSGGSYTIKLTNDGESIPPAFVRTTSVGASASAASIASALNSIGEVDPGHKWEFFGESDSENAEDDFSHVVRMKAIPTAIFPDLAVENGSLSGFPKGAWDEYPYEVPLTPGPTGKLDVPTSEIEPTEAQSEPTKTRSRKMNQHVTGPQVQMGDGLDPFPHHDNDETRDPV